MHRPCDDSRVCEKSHCHPSSLYIYADSTPGHICYMAGLTEKRDLQFELGVGCLVSGGERAARFIVDNHREPIRKDRPQQPRPEPADVAAQRPPPDNGGHGCRVTQPEHVWQPARAEQPWRRRRRRQQQRRIVGQRQRRWFLARSVGCRLTCRRCCPLAVSRRTVSALFFAACAMANARV